MKLKTCAVLGALCLFAAAPASALTVRNFGLGDLSNASLTFPMFTPGPGDFLDIFEFSISGAGAGFGGAANIVFDDPNFEGVESNFNIAAISMMSGATTLASDTDGSDGFSLFAVFPGAGVYQFAVLGQADGTVNGAYTGFVQTQIAPAVPEPETYALTLLGLGAVAASVGRRKAAPGKTA
jgi:hypothetical protein